MRPIAAMAVMAGVILAIGPAWGEVAGAQASTPPPKLERPAHFVLANAAPSVDALIDRLLVALEKNDADGLHRLRLTENEYRAFVLPGSVQPGQPAQVYDDDSSKFAWGKLNTNSIYAATGIIRGYGGHKYTVKEVTYLKGRVEYAWYTAYKTVSLKLEDETGQEGELVLGSIAEIDGQFKFISLLGKS
jgi:hypothetical protein